MRTITLEEHYASPGFLEGPGKEFKAQVKRADSPIGHVLDKLTDVDSKRIAEMDAAGIDVQVLSLNSPGTEQLDAAEAVQVAREANDFAAEAISCHPTRFAGFAALPTADPKAAVAELERMVKQGFKGAMINGHVQGRYLDNPFFWPILECAEALNVPLYIHPTPPPPPVSDVYYSGFDPMVNSMLRGAGFGWHVETAVHVLRMAIGGAFDRFPRLQVITGHLGETLPFMIQRVDMMTSFVTKLKRPLSAYLRENVHYTISGFNFIPSFLNLFMEVGADRIMFSADYPYSSMERARAFLDQIPVSAADREKIAHGNAERLLGMQVS